MTSHASDTPHDDSYCCWMGKHVRIIVLDADERETEHADP
jgi:hypothetical protein